ICLHKAGNILQTTLTAFQLLATQRTSITRPTFKNNTFKHTSLKQDAKSRSVNSWLKRLQHSLSLEYGDIEYGEIQKIFQSLKFDRNYVKGLQKQQIIEEFMPHATVFNFENLDCPRLCQLNGETLPCCIFHMDFNPQQCTLYKVFALKRWYLHHIKL
ncbi:Uncharacterized protein FWK35_00029720, partial [Aphis craccivora]